MDPKAEPVDDISNDLAAAWDASEEERLGGDPPPEDPPKLTVVEGGEEPPEGAEIPTGDVPVGEPPEDKPPVEDPPLAAASDVEKAPVGLSPEAREAWKDTPKAMQAAITKREADYAAGIQQYAEGHKQFQAMNQSLAPFQQYIQMNGGPQSAIGAALQTASILQMGAPMQKAEAVANLIKQFGIDIGSLDSLLVGEKPQPGQNAELAQMLDQRLGPINQFMTGYQENQQQQATQAQTDISTEIDTFSAANEFYGDLKMDMADLMDMAANRGKNMTLKEAYDKAILMHPQISSIVSGRIGQKQVDTKRRAASSIKGTLGGPGGGSAEGTMRQSLEDAWDNIGRT